MKFDFKVWRTDSNLRRCSLETRGFWIECLCAMNEADEWKIEGSYDELGWLIGCSPEVVARCVLELKRTGTADVTLSNGNVTLESRRLQREAKVREQTRLRVQKLRGNDDVTHDVQDRVRSKSKKEEEEGASHPTASDFGTPRNRPPEDSPFHHPVIESFRSVTKHTPPRETWPHLISRLGATIDVALLTNVFAEWRAKGFKATNYDGIADWYLERVKKSAPVRTQRDELRAEGLIP